MTSTKGPWPADMVTSCHQHVTAQNPTVETTILPTLPFTTSTSRSRARSGPKPITMKSYVMLKP